MRSCSRALLRLEQRHNAQPVPIRRGDSHQSLVLQTLDRGAPVSLYTVSREMGHSSTSTVEQVYSHLGTVRHRSEVVEYRVEQHEKVLGDRLSVLRMGLGTMVSKTPAPAST